MLRENNSKPVSVSGYKGYLGVKNNKLCVTKFMMKKIISDLRLQKM